MTIQTLRALRAAAVCRSLFPPTGLKEAVERLGFVQADPIRSPARAQDLILRQRVTGYRNGDLERQYATLDIEEDLLYAYGFMPRPVWSLLHPRNTAGLTKLEKRVFEIVRSARRMHPKELEEHLGRKRVVNAWGSYSKATTRALEDLHYRGLLRIAGRENGIRTYEAVSRAVEPVPQAERLRKLTMLVAGILAPAPERSLRSTIVRFQQPRDTRTALDDLLRTGELEKQTVDGLSYVWPALASADVEEAPRRVLFLAPFDPVVWDRLRFEHLWNWAYRFEAYTPPAKRIRGYYAMPLLWCDRVVGWANARVAGQQLDVEVGFVKERPREKDFRPSLDDEIARLAAFLGIPEP